MISHSEAIGLAKASCLLCLGGGLRRTYVRAGRDGKYRAARSAPCNCIFRAIFRACLNRFRYCEISADHIGSVTLEFARGGEGRRQYSRKREEYAADFCLVSRRSLDDAQHTLFRYHFLLGADWKLCCKRLGMDRGAFFHEVYRIEQSLGRTFLELRPYALYPLDEYFGGPLAAVKTLAAGAH